MRLAFFVNDVATEVDEYTTTRLARAAAQGGREDLVRRGRGRRAGGRETGSSWAGLMQRPFTDSTRSRAS